MSRSENVGESGYGQGDRPATTEVDARRARASTRIPFDGVVEVGAELGPPFEAQAVDVSGTGMHLRTAYLPDIGQTLSCRFEAGREMVIATGEVVWQKEAGRGGEFGLRFVDLDQESAIVLERMTDKARLRVPGARVRLHIDGLGAPMRARVKGTSKSELTVGSELGFLQVGKHIDLEDAESGHRRPAFIDRVEVDIDPSSRIPQLVVALKYEDVEDEMAADAPKDMIDTATSHDKLERPQLAAPMQMDERAGEGMAHDAPGTSHAEGASFDAHARDEYDDEPNMDGVDVPMSDPVAAPAPTAPDVYARTAEQEDEALVESMNLKGPVARAAAKVTPALERFAKRTKTTAMLLVERARSRKATESSPIRRTTAPPPGGSLHAAGRKVVRGEPSSADKREIEPQNESRLAAIMADKKKMTLMGAGAVAVLALGVSFAAKKSAPPPEVPAEIAAAAPIAAEPTPAMPGAPATPVAPGALPASAGPTGVAPTTPATVEIASTSGSTPSGFGDPVVADKNPVGDSDSKPIAKKTGIKVTPFSHGGVTRGNLLRLKMDGAIEKIQGASQPTGFTVHIPNRRSLEPAAPLAARDARIGSIKVVNDPGGAELSVTFKDGVPNYTVRAKGDQLEIVLASPNAAAKEEPVASKPAATPHKKTAKHAKKKKAH